MTGTVAVAEFRDVGLRQIGMGLDLDHGGLNSRRVEDLLHLLEAYIRPLEVEFDIPLRLSAAYEDISLRRWIERVRLVADGSANQRCGRRRFDRTT